MPDRTCGEAAIALLPAYGVNTVFDIPGVHTLELYYEEIGGKWKIQILRR